MFFHVSNYKNITFIIDYMYSLKLNAKKEVLQHFHYFSFNQSIVICQALNDFMFMIKISNEYQQSSSLFQ